jgi:predicted GNAT family acetyltransferase
MTDDTTVTRNDEASRYEIRVGDTLAGFAKFDRRTDEIRFIHTEVDPAFQGKGLAGILAADALADAAGSGDTLVPYCPYIAEYLKSHEVEGANIRWPQLPADPTDATGAR